MQNLCLTSLDADLNLYNQLYAIRLLLLSPSFKKVEDMIVHKDLNIYNLVLRALVQSLLTAFLSHLQFPSLCATSCR